MANYHYDEAGNMAAYFLITFLALILTPVTFSLKPVFSAYCQFVYEPVTNAID
jgi:translocation protein SEC63